MRKRLAALAALCALVTGCGHAVTHTAPHPGQKAAQVVAGELPVQQICLASNPGATGCTPEGATRFAPPPIGVPRSSTGPTLDRQGARLIEYFEGYSRCAYWDPYGRVWTAGFGQTQGIYGGFCFRSREAAEDNLIGSVKRGYEWAVNEACGHACGQHQVNALDSAVYNLGPYLLRLNHSLFSAVHRGAFRTVCAILSQYVYAGGVRLAGLVTRRRLECAELERAVVRPKPLTPAQLRAKRKRLLTHERSYYNALGVVVTVHNCDRRRYHHPRNASRRQCNVWSARRAHAHREILRLRRLLAGS